MGTKKVSILPQSPSPCFLNPMNSRMKPVKTFKLSANFLSLFVITEIFQNKITSVSKQCICKEFRSKFPFHGLEKQQPGIHNHFRLGVSWNMIHLRNVQIRYLNCKFEVKFKKWFSSFIMSYT